MILAASTTHIIMGIAPIVLLLTFASSSSDEANPTGRPTTSNVVADEVLRRQHKGRRQSMSAENDMTARFTHADRKGAL
jgi:hypothetical protein